MRLRLNTEPSSIHLSDTLAMLTGGSRNLETLIFQTVPRWLPVVVGKRR